jgi:hypothetical protein
MAQCYTAINTVKPAHIVRLQNVFTTKHANLGILWALGFLGSFLVKFLKLVIG